MNSNAPNQCALVLSGGAALGAAHLGVVEVLQKRGYHFDYYAGVSAGAIIAAALACGKDASYLIDFLQRLKLFGLAFDFSKTWSGLVRGKRIQELLEKLYEGKNFEDLQFPLRIGVTDFATGERHTIRTGNITAAVRASLSVPIVFEPYYHQQDGRCYVDGGLTQNLPLDIAVSEYQGSTIFSCDVCSSFHQVVPHAEGKILGKLKNLRMAAERTLRIVFKNQQVSLPNDSRVTKILPHLEEFNGLSANKIPVIIQRGREAAEEIFNSGKRSR